MSLIRLKDNTPSVYQEQSRDFQLICRLYDCVINGVKFDIDSMENIIDTSKCINNVLPLLQTKLGFFTSLNITDEELRYVLKAFPLIVKHKGSIKAIKQSVIVYLKLIHNKTSAVVEYTTKVTSEEDTTTPYSVRIRINSSVKDTSILDALLKYVIPTGFLIEYSFYGASVSSDTVLGFSDSAGGVITSNEPDALVRGNYTPYVWVEDTTYSSTGIQLSGTGKSPMSEHIIAKSSSAHYYNSSYDGSSAKKSWTSTAVTIDDREKRYVGATNTAVITGSDVVSDKLVDFNDISQ